MAARVVAAVEERLVVVVATAEAALDQQPLATLKAFGQPHCVICWQLAGRRR
jgi:uncharacterized protein YcgL (UPF0745 family)